MGGAYSVPEKPSKKPAGGFVMPKGPQDDLGDYTSGEYDIPGNIPGGFASKQEEKPVGGEVVSPGSMGMGAFAKQFPGLVNKGDNAGPAPPPSEQIAGARQDMDAGLTDDLPSNVGGLIGAGGAGAAAGATANIGGNSSVPGGFSSKQEEAPAQQGGKRRGKQRPAGNKRRQPIRNMVKNIRNRRGPFGGKG